MRVAARSGPSVRSSGWTMVFLAVLVCFLFYLKTLAPTVLYYNPTKFPDSVVLQIQAVLLGIPHTTGYPTWVMLAHLFTYLPFGDPAYRVNLSSAVFAAATVFLVCLVCLRLTKRVVPSCVAALLFGLGRDFWSQAVIAEVYTLNTLFVALVILLLLLWRDTRDDRYLLLVSLSMGLALTDHLTSGLLLPAGALFVGLVDRHKLKDLRLVSKGAVLFLVALAPYLYLPIRSSMNPPLSREAPTTLGSFFELVSGAKFADRMFAYGPADLAVRTRQYFSDYLTHQFFYAPVLLLALVGVARLLSKDRPALATLAFLYLGWLVYALEYDIRDVYVFYVPTYLVLSILVAAGVAAVLDGAAILARNSQAKLGKAALIGLTATMLVLPFVGVGQRYKAVDQSRDYTGQRTIECVAEKSKRGATILQHRSLLSYMALVEGRRSDLNIVEAFPPGGWTARSDLWVEKSQRYLAKGPVYVLFPVMGIERSNAPSFDAAGYRLVPEGCGAFYEVLKESQLQSR
jgi:Na+-transporting methylmalonyl-CoA/oxaloacetate decarboxylase beta subunit